MSETPAEIRDRANDKLLESAVLHRLAVLRSGEWAELGYRSFPEYVAAKNELHQATLTLSPPDRRELVGQLSSEGHQVADIAAVVNRSTATIERDRASNEGRQWSKPQVNQQLQPSDEGRTIVDPAPPPDPAVAAAARAAVEAERAALEAKQDIRRRADIWLDASETLRHAADALRKALDVDPHGDAARTHRPDTAGKYLDLLGARTNEVTTLIGAVRSDVLRANGLRRVK